MLPQIVAWDEACRVPEDCSEGARVQLAMPWYGQSLATSCSSQAKQFRMTPALGDDRKTKAEQHGDDIVAGKTPQPNHAPVPTPW